MKCQNGHYFCPLSMRCLPSKQACIGMSLVNNSFAIKGDWPCSDEGEKLCLKKEGCYNQTKGETCKAKDYTKEDDEKDREMVREGFKVVNLADAFGYFCDDDMKWCVDSLQCVKKDEDCPAFDIGDPEEDKSKGMKPFCKMKNFICLRYETK